MYAQTTAVLEKYDNQHDFERLCAAILNAQGFKDVVLIAPRGGGDGGKDITFTTESGGKGLACVTLRKDIEKKFKEDFHQRKQGEFDKYILYCTAYLTKQQKLDFSSHCNAKLQAEFLPQDIEALASLLDTTLVTVRKKWLYLTDEERQERQDAISQLALTVRKRGVSISQYYRAEHSDPGIGQRWPRSQHVFLELLPLDSTNDILAFGYQGGSRPSPDMQVQDLLRHAGWHIRTDLQDDVLPKSDGVGIVAIYTGRSNIRVVDIPSKPACIFYFDRSGGVFIDLPAASFSHPQPSNVPIDHPQVIGDLLLRLSLLIQGTLKLLSEQGYVGRIQTTIWAELDTNLPPQQIGDAPLDRRFDPAQSQNRGSTIFLTQDIWSEFSVQLAHMVSQMTRTWLRYPFTLDPWIQGTFPDIQHHQ